MIPSESNGEIGVHANGRDGRGRFGRGNKFAAGRRRAGEPLSEAVTSELNGIADQQRLLDKLIARISTDADWRRAERLHREIGRRLRPLRRRLMRGKR